MGKKRVPVSNDPFDILVDELGLDSADWRIDQHFSKSVFRGNQRGVCVTVTHLPTAKSREKWLPARSKRHARELGLEIAVDLLFEWVSNKGNSR